MSDEREPQIPSIKTKQDDTILFSLCRDMNFYAMNTRSVVGLLSGEERRWWKSACHDAPCIRVAAFLLQLEKGERKVPI